MSLKAKTLIAKAQFGLDPLTKVLLSLGSLALGGELACMGLALLLTLASPQADANPRFARETGKACSFCHSGPPRLNDTGAAFKANGFQFPTADETPDKDHKGETAQ